MKEYNCALLLQKISFSIRWKNKPAAPNTAYEPTLIEHVANIVTHGVSICYITLEIFNFDDTNLVKSC